MTEDGEAAPDSALQGLRRLPRMQVVCRSAAVQDWVLYLGVAQRSGADAALLQALQEAAVATGLPLSGARHARLMQANAVAAASPATRPALARLRHSRYPATHR